MSAEPLAELLSRDSGEAHIALIRALEVLPPDVFTALLHEAADGWQSRSDCLIRLSQKRHGRRSRVHMDLVQPSPNFRRAGDIPQPEE